MHVAHQNIGTFHVFVIFYPLFHCPLCCPYPASMRLKRSWILNLDLLTSSYFTRPTTSENFPHDNSTQKEGLLSLASSFPTTPPSNTLLNDNIHLSLIHLLMIINRYPKRILSKVWRGYIFQSCLCKYVRSRACCNYLGIP